MFCKPVRWHYSESLIIIKRFLISLQCNSQHTTQVSLSQKTPEQQKVFKYKLKVTNRKKKSQYEIKSLKAENKFYTIDDLRKCIKEEIEQFADTVGYVEPGHGIKGKMMCLGDDEDLSEMYVVHKRKSEVLLWCYGDLGEGSMSSTGVEQSDSTWKRPHSETSAPASKRSASIADTINAVEAIIVKLRKKHGESRFSVEKLNCWAHMLNCGKWSSYDDPPKLPFFKE